MKSTKSPQKVFIKIVNENLTNAPREAIKELALAIWYEKFIPDISVICDSQNIQRAAYLLERLMAFNCVETVVREKLKETIHTLEMRAKEQIEVLPLSYVLNSNQILGDPLAKRWGLQESLKLQIQALLPYQTRHYKHPRKSK